MNEYRLQDYLDHMQQAVIKSLIIIGEAVTKIMDQYTDLVEKHSVIPWRSMRGIRNHRSWIL